MDFDDRLGALQTKRQAFVVALQLGVLRRQRMDRLDLGAALDGLQRFVAAGVALPAPLAQLRGIEPLAPQDSADAARPRLVNLAQYPQLFGCREGATTRPVAQFGRGRRWR